MKKAKEHIIIKKKKNRLIFSGLFLVASFLLFYLICKKVYFLSFSKELFIIFTMIDLFILSNFVFDRKKIYDFLYKRRYIIGLVILLVLVLGKYNGSSTAIWNSYIQPEYKIENSVIFGKTRNIRSDEWLVSTPSNLSQATSTVDFSTYNTVLGAHKNLVMLQPNLPSKDISILSTPNKMGYLFLDVERAYSLSWYLPGFILFFATFELLMILLNGNKLYSVLGAIMVTFSPTVQWWQSGAIPAYGTSAVVLFYYFLNTDGWKKKLLLSILIGYFGYLYIMCIYPAWLVPYAYVYLLLVIWIVVNNKKKITKKDFLYLIPLVLVIAIPLFTILHLNKEIFNIMSSTVYPGARKSTGGGEYITLFTYVLSIFYPYKDLGNPCEFSQYISLFPIPFFYAIYLLIKNKKKDLFLIMSCILMTFFCIWIFFPLPGIISKLTLMNYSTPVRSQVIIGYLSLLMLLYILANYQIKELEKIFNIKNLVIVIISFISIFLTIKLSNNVINKFSPGYVSLKTSLISLIIFTFIVVLFLYNHKKTNVILVLSLIFVTLLSSALVAPLNKGLDVFYKKPVAKEIKKLVKKDKNSIFMSADNTIITSNYIIVNGGKTINSTNQVPNLKLYHKLDPDLEYEDVYNRYEHVAVEVIDEGETSFELVQPDCIRLHITKSDVCKIGVDYLVTVNNDLHDLNYDLIYNKYGAYIFKTNCN